MSALSNEADMGPGEEPLRDVDPFDPAACGSAPTSRRWRSSA